MTSGQESHVTPPPIRYQFPRSLTGTFLMLGNADIGIMIDLPSCKSTRHLPRFGNESDLILGFTFQYPSGFNIVLFSLLFYIDNSNGLSCLEQSPLFE